MKNVIAILTLIFSSTIYAIDAAEVTRRNAEVTKHFYENGVDHVNRDVQSENNLNLEGDKLSKYEAIPQLNKFLSGRVKKGQKFKINTEPKYTSSIQDGDEWYRFAWFSVVDGYGPYLVEVEMKKCKGSYEYDKQENFKLKEFWAVVEFTGKIESTTASTGKAVKVPVLNAVECL